VKSNQGCLTEITYSFATGGSERIALAIAAEAMEQGVTTTACATHGGYGPVSDHLRELGVSCEAVQLGFGGRVGRAVRLFLHFRRNRTRIAHVHHFDMASIIYWPARLAGVRRVVITEHTDYALRTRPRAFRLARRYGSLADLTTVVHQGIADYLVSEVGLDPASVRVVVNGVDTSRFLPGHDLSLRDKLGASRDACVVGSVGRLHPDKDPMNLLQAIASLDPDVRRGLHILIVGDGPSRHQVLRFVEEQSIGESVRFLGERHDIAELMGAMDVFVLPSRTEGLPVALLEAMSCGLPSVATDVGGVAAVLGDAGIMVAPEDAQALADGLAVYAADREKASLDGKRARQRAVALFDRSVMLSGYREALWG